MYTKRLRGITAVFVEVRGQTSPISPSVTGEGSVGRLAIKILFRWLSRYSSLQIFPEYRQIDFE